MNLLVFMQTNPTAELVVTMDPSHPGYLRDSVNREKLLVGPFEQDDYRPLIDAGQLVESEEFCSVFVLATAATPPDFTGCDFSQTVEEQSEIPPMIDVSTHNHFFVSGGLWEFVSYDSPEYEKALVDNPEYTGPVFKEVATTRDIIISGLNHYIPRPGDRELESLTQDVFEELKGRPTNG